MARSAAAASTRTLVFVSRARIADSRAAGQAFCSNCGSTLFWDPIQRDSIAIAMGAFDTPTQTHLKMHIFVADKGDYYEIADGLPQNQR